MESSLEVSNNLIVHDKAYVDNDVSFGAMLTVMGDVSMESSLEVSNNLIVHDKAYVDNDVSFGAMLTVMGDVSMESSLDVSNVILSHLYINTPLLGINTADPSYSIHIDSSDAILLPVGGDSERPTTTQDGLIRYNTDSSQFEGYSSGNWQGLGGVIDIDQDTKILAEQSNDEDHLRFFTAGVERMTIDASGNTGIGINTPSSSYKLDVDGSLHISGTLVSDSDQRIKDNITVLPDCLGNIDTIHGYSFTRTDLEDKTKRHIGVLAQEVEVKYPELVMETEEVKSVNYSGLCGVLIQCVKELKEQNVILSKRIDALENK